MNLGAGWSAQMWLTRIPPKSQSLTFGGILLYEESGGPSWTIHRRTQKDPAEKTVSAGSLMIMVNFRTASWELFGKKKVFLINRQVFYQIRPVK